MVARSVRSRPSPPAAGGLRLTLLSLVLAAPLLPGPTQGRPQDPPFPTEQELRDLQQLVFTCGRENSSGPCEQARRQADPLLDHPRLAGSCKDVLWQIREQAVVANANSFSRRDQLDRIGLDLLRICQQQRPQPKPASSGSSGQGRRPLFAPSQQP